MYKKSNADAKIKAQIALTYFVERKNTEQNKCLRSCSDKIRLAMTDRWLRLSINQTKTDADLLTSAGARQSIVNLIINFKNLNRKTLNRNPWGERQWITLLQEELCYWPDNGDNNGRLTATHSHLWVARDSPGTGPYLARHVERKLTWAFTACRVVVTHTLTRFAL